jgi:negative regulator of replication initiation
MSNTTPRAVRVPDDLWDAALAATAANGETVSDVIRRALAQYVARNPSDD